MVGKETSLKRAFFPFLLLVFPLWGEATRPQVSISGLLADQQGALFTYVHTDFQVQWDETREGELFLRTDMRFPSPIQSPHSENNTVHCVLIEPKGATKATLIVLPIWGNSDTLLEEIVARSLAGKGYRSLILSMAYQHKRSPVGVRSGSLTVSADLEQTAFSIHQSVVDVRRAAYWLTHERNVNPEQLGILGISLGSFVASLSFCAERNFRAAALILGGGNPGSVLLRDSSETGKIAQTLLQDGWTEASLSHALRPFSPEAYASSQIGRRVLMINAIYDTVVPYESTLSLYEAYGNPRIVWIPASHYSGLFFLSDLIEELDSHFSTWMKPVSAIIP